MSREFQEVLLREKIDTGVADPAAWSYLDNDSLRVTVGGTTSNGVYSITITPETPPSGTTSFTASFTRAAAETDTQIGAALDAALDALLAVASNGIRGARLADYVSAVSNASGVVSIVFKPDMPCRVNVSLVDPGTATLTPSPSSTYFPITRDFLGWSPTVGARSKLEFTITAVDSSGNALDPGTATVDLTVRRMLPALTSGGPVEVSSATTQTAFPVGGSYRVAAGGGRYGVSFGAIGGGAITGLHRLRVRVRQVSE